MTRYETSTRLGLWFRQAVSQWQNQVWLQSTVPIRPRPPQIFLYTDASKTGLRSTLSVWGGVRSLVGPVPDYTVAQWGQGLNATARTVRGTRHSRFRGPTGVRGDSSNRTQGDRSFLIPR